MKEDIFHLKKKMKEDIIKFSKRVIIQKLCDNKISSREKFSQVTESLSASVKVSLQLVTLVNFAFHPKNTFHPKKKKLVNFATI